MIVETRPLWLALVALVFVVSVLTDKSLPFICQWRDPGFVKELAHHEAITWAQVKNLPRRKRIRIDVFFVDRRVERWEKVFIARSAKSDEYCPLTSSTLCLRQLARYRAYFFGWD